VSENFRYYENFEVCNNLIFSLIDEESIERISRSVKFFFLIGIENLLNHLMTEARRSVHKKNFGQKPLRVLIDKSATSTPKNERYSPSPVHKPSILKFPTPSVLTRCHSTSLVYSEKNSQDSESLSPSLSRRILKISQTKPQSAFEDIRTVRVADANGLFKKFHSIKQYIKPEEEMINKLKAITKNKKSVNQSLDNLFYNQIKKKELDLDSKTVMNFTLQEISQKGLVQARQKHIRRKIVDNMSKSPSVETSVEKTFPKKLKLIRRKQEKGEELRSLKQYSIVQKETLALWQAAQEKGKDLKKHILNSFFEKNNPVQIVLESYKYKKQKASNLVW